MRGPTVAVVGPDGSGKSTVTRRLTERVPDAVRVYMGVNLEESNVALPTTRLILAWKRSRGGRPDLAGRHASSARSPHSARRVFRVLNLIAEEWFRAAIVSYHSRRGRTVVMDRHFLADYWTHDVAHSASGDQPWVSRLHGYLLWRWYPRPDRFLFLDACPELLADRRPDTPREWLVGRHGEYVEFASAVPGVVTVPAEGPLEEIVDRCLEATGAPGAFPRS